MRAVAAVSDRRKNPKKNNRRSETAATERKTKVAKSDRAWFREWRRSLPEGIERDTLLVPVWIAESVCQEVSRYLNQPTPLGLVGWLDRKARICYERNEDFKKIMQSRGNRGRDMLYAYMRHWTAGWLRKNRLQLYNRLPKEFVNGG